MGAASAKGAAGVSKVPGPGMYNPNWAPLECNPRKVPFSQVSFDKLPDNKVPGPGSYEVPSTLNGNVVTKKSRNVLFTNFVRVEHKTITPGPMGQATTFKIP